MGNITRALGDIASYGVGVIPHHRGLAGLRLRRSVASRRLGFAFGEDAGRSKFGFRLEAKFLVASLDAFATFVALRFGDNSELTLGLGSGSLVGVRVQWWRKGGVLSIICFISRRFRSRLSRVCRLQRYSLASRRVVPVVTGRWSRRRLRVWNLERGCWWTRLRLGVFELCRFGRGACRICGGR